MVVHRGVTEWGQCDLKQSAEVSAVEIYRFDDAGRENCRVPDSWRLLYRSEGEWKEVPNPRRYDTEKDRFNEFEPVTTDGLRIEVKLRKGHSGGVLEWRVVPIED